jgi:SAM-dependent methyltransferase
MRKKLHDLIVSGLGVKYVSTSSFNNYTTGNRYQSIRLGEETVAGYRTNRQALFEAFNFKGRKVLDCGCNIGEMSRLARTRGAALVDGYEYDGYFVEIGRLVNAYNGVTRVSLYERDLTRPDSFDDTFDVTLAFSVFPYISQVLDQIVRITGEALIIETHDIKPNLRKVYIEPLIRHFPHYTFVTDTDFGDGESSRAVFVMARKESALYGADAIVQSTLNVGESSFDFLNPILSITSGVTDIRSAPVERLRTILKACEGTPDDLSRVTAGKSYWLAMILGYVEYRETGRVTETNSYVKALRQTLATVPFDPALSRKLDTLEAVILRVLLRFKDADTMSEGDKNALTISPVRIKAFSRQSGRYRIRHGVFGNDLFCDLIDGYHRVFWAKLLDIAKLNAVYVLE